MINRAQAKNDHKLSQREIKAAEEKKLKETKKNQKDKAQQERLRQQEIFKAGAQKLPGDDFRRILESEKENLKKRASQEYLASLGKSILAEMTKFHMSIDSQPAKYFMQKNSKNWQAAQDQVERKQREYDLSTSPEQRLKLKAQIREQGNIVADLSFEANKLHLAKALEKFETEAKRIGTNNTEFAANAKKATIVTKKEIEFIESIRNYQRKADTTTSMDSCSQVKKQFDDLKSILNKLKEELSDVKIDFSQLKLVKQKLDKLNRDEELFRSVFYDTALGMIVININNYRKTLEETNQNQETIKGFRDYIVHILCQSDCAIEFINFYYGTNEAFIDDDERSKIQEDFTKRLEQEPEQFLAKVDEFTKQEAQAKAKCLVKEEKFRDYIDHVLCQSDCPIEFINFYYGRNEAFIGNDERSKIQEDFKKRLEQEPEQFLAKVDEFTKQEAQAKAKCLVKEFESINFNDPIEAFNGLQTRAARKLLGIENKYVYNSILALLDNDELIETSEKPGGIRSRQIKEGKEGEVIKTLAESFVDEKKGTQFRLLKRDTYMMYQEELVPCLKGMFWMITNDIFPRIYNQIGFFKDEVMDQLTNFETSIIDSQNKHHIDEIKGTRIFPLEIIERATVLGTNSSTAVIGNRQRLIIDSEKLAMSTAIRQKEAEIYLEDLEKDRIDIFSKPQYLDEYFTAYEAYSARNKQGQVDTKEFRQKHREDLIARKAFAQTSSNYIDTTDYKKSPGDLETYWGLYDIEREEAIKGLFKKASCIKDLIVPFIEEHQTQFQNNVSFIRDTESINLTQEVLDSEASLRAIAASKNPIILMNQVLRGTVIPTKSSQEPKTSTFENLSKILTTQALTQVILGDEIAKAVDWKALIEGDLASINRNFSNDWIEYQKNPEEFVKKGKDPHGLMRVRTAWYNYMKTNMGSLEALNKYAQSGTLQNFAKTTVKRNFTSFEDRENSNPNWQTYYQEHLGI